MSKYKPLAILLAIIVSVTIVPARAQMKVGTGGIPNAPSAALPETPSTSTQGDQAQKFGTVVAQPAKSSGTGKDKALTPAKIMGDAQTLANSLQLSCNVSDAALTAQGPTTVNGQAVNTASYEVACGNGMGYFLVSQYPGKPYSFSCLAINATSVADVARGKPADAVCKLHNNADVKTMATTVLKIAGTNCGVRDLRWVGVSTISNTEYTEVVCNDGTGYMLGTALEGSNAPVRVATCHDSKIACKLSNGGPSAFTTPVVTIQSLKDALVQHGVACDASKVRVIGQEATQKRYVAEFQCAQQPNGLIAFIPLSGNAAKFETLDCAEAPKRGLVCKMAAKNVSIRLRP